MRRSSWHKNPMARDLLLKRTVYVGIIVLSLFFFEVKQVAAALTAGQLTGILVGANVGKKTLDPKVVGAGPAVTVLAQAKPEATDNELKIDAVFYAKTLVESAPGQIETIKVLYAQTGKPGRFVSVSKTSIEEFGAGKKTPGELLASLTLISVQEESAPNVVPGPELERRLLLWRRIEKLKQKGTGVKPFETLFAQLETMSKEGGGNEFLQKITYLETKLSDQEEQVKQAKKAASGKGIISRTGSSSSGSHTPPSTAAIPTPSGPGGADLTLPPNAEQIIQSYSSGSANILNHVPSGQDAQLRQLKQQIDQCISAKRLGQACALIAQFHSLSMRLTGIDIMAPPGGGPPGGGPPGGGPP